MAWVADIGGPRGVAPRTGGADIDYLSKVPYRSIGR